MFVSLAGCRWTGDAADTAFNEFSASALLEKYEWFKDAAAQLDKKFADIGVYEYRLLLMKESNDNAPRNMWEREDREQFNVWASEIAGVIASYNSLAAEYNSNMSKGNWDFTNVGNLPQGATTTLPREFREYIYK